MGSITSFLKSCYKEENKSLAYKCIENEKWTSYDKIVENSFYSIELLGFQI